MAVARWLIALWFIGLAGLNSGIAAVEVTASPHLSLVGQVDLCVDPAGQQTIETIVAGDCPFTPATTADLARGFDPGVLWLRLTLVNPTPQPVERWLTIGHPRLRSVQLFERSRPEAPWRRLATGTAVPAAQRPVQTTYPVLPLTLPPDATQTVYVRVASITSIDLTPTLWEPLAYLNAIHAIDLAHVATIGGVLLMALLSGLIFWQMRERMYLYFGLALFGYLVSEGAHSGLLPLYLWPFRVVAALPVAGRTAVLYRPAKPGRRLGDAVPAAVRAGVSGPDYVVWRAVVASTVMGRRWRDLAGCRLVGAGRLSQRRSDMDHWH